MPYRREVDQHAEEVAALRQSVLETPGSTKRVLREAAFRGEQLPAPIESYVSKIQNHSYLVVDDDVAELLAVAIRRTRLS